MTQVDPTASGEDGYITEDPSLAAGKKYLALHVPNFSQNLHSYLCLGAATQWFEDAVAGTNADPSKHGQTLANMVVGFCDDDRAQDARTAKNQLGEAITTPSPPGETVDDVGAAPTNTTTTPAGPFAPGTPDAPKPVLMQNESALLQQKGGWRDHSDGNRITTTFGDKVEVIRGNYKLLVLGRQDDPKAQVAGWDVSGGLVSSAQKDLNYPPPDPSVDPAHSTFPPFPQAKYGGQQALSTQYTWEQNADGNWAWTMETLTGVYDLPAAPTNLGNGRIVSYTWADEMLVYQGTGKPGSEETDPHPLKSSITKTYAQQLIQEARAMQALPPHDWDSDIDLTMTAMSDGTLEQNTTSVGDMMSITTAGGAMDATFTCGDLPLSVLLPPVTATNGMNTLTASLGLMNEKVHTEADMINETSSKGAMNLIVTAGDLPPGIVPGLPSFVPFTESSTPGSLNSTTASTGTLNTLLHTEADMNNEMSANGPIYNHMSTSDAVHNLTSAMGDITDSNACVGTHTSVDASLTQFNFVLSLMVLELKLGMHVDIHNIHMDSHIGSHLDLHVSPHFTMDFGPNVNLHAGPPPIDVQAAGWVGISPFKMFL